MDQVSRTARLPWLSPRAIGLIVMALCTPYLFADIPPQVDVPGHIAAAAIEAAGPDSPLARFYAWQWSFNLNLGGEVLMKMLGGGIAAGWWTNLIATAVFGLGALLTFRALNARGCHGAGWALVYVFAFPWIWGFTNFILAAGLSLVAFGIVSGLDRSPATRAAVLITAQPLALLCHAVGGLTLPILVAASTLGAVIDGKTAGGGGAPARDGAVRNPVSGSLAPLVATPLVIGLWKFTGGTAISANLRWNWLDKLGFLFEVLRDQHFLFDVATAVAGYVLILSGRKFGARWTWRQGLPGLALFALYAAMPAGIGGSEAVDTRLLALLVLLGLGMQDWSGAKPGVARAIAISGALILLARLAAVSASFASYAGEYRNQLGALAFIGQGSRVAAIARHGCAGTEWRMSRLDMLPALASATRGAWVNINWTVPGLHMARSRIDPAQGNAKRIPQFVWDPPCEESAGSTLATALPGLPYDSIDYLWLVDTGPPPGFSQGALVWQWRRSYLYRIDRGVGEAAVR